MVVTHRCIKQLWCGKIVFILSGACFFAGFFWVFYHSNIRPMLELGSCWPTRGTYLLHPLEVPLFNTSILPTSGIFIISVHHCPIEGNHKQILQPMFITIALRVINCEVINFTVLWKRVTISDSIVERNRMSWIIYNYWYRTLNHILFTSTKILLHI